MRIATWNVNSVTSRIEHVTRWLTSAAPDVLCLQELKCTTDAFPVAAVADRGYEVAAHGNGRWNGVAILSRVGLADVVRDLPDQPGFEGVVEPRAIGATCASVRVWSVYVPNGRDVDNPHYAYKLDWLASLRAMAAAETATLDPGQPYAVLGDFNVAPTDADVWDPTLFVGATHVTEAERAAVGALGDLGLADVMPRPLKYDHPFTYWDYRQLSFPKNTGMRIDLVLANQAWRDRQRDAYVDRDARKGKGTSDHAPVVVDLEPGT